MKLQGLLSKNQEPNSFLSLVALLSLRLLWCSPFAIQRHTFLKHRDIPVVSVDPHSCLGILPVTWCPVGAPLTLTLPVFVSSLLLGVGIGRDHGQGWRSWLQRMLSGGQAVVGGGNVSRGSRSWQCFIVSLDFTYTFKDKITENFQDVDHRALKPQVWVPF